MRRWEHVVDRPRDVDEALDRNDPYAGVALLVLVLNNPDPDVTQPRILRGLTSPQPQPRRTTGSGEKRMFQWIYLVKSRKITICLTAPS